MKKQTVDTAQTKTKETYQQMKARQETEYNSLYNELKPLVFYAFGRDQQKKALEAYTAAGGKMDELTSTSAGLTGSRAEIMKMFKLCERHKAEITDALKTREFAKTAFIYEMANHEYSYTHEDADVMNALGLDADNIPENLRECYEEARREYIGNAY